MVYWRAEVFLSRDDGGCDHSGKSCARPNANGDFQPTEVGMSISTSGTVNLSDLKLLNPGCRHQVERIQGTRYHCIVAYGGGQFDETFFSQPTIECLKSRFARPMRTQQFLDIADDLRIVGGETLRPLLLMNSPNGFNRNASLLRVGYVRVPFVLAFQLPCGRQRGQLDQFVIEARFESHVTAQMSRSLG